MAGLAKFQGQGWWTGNAFWGIARRGRVPPLRPDLAGRLSVPDPALHPRRACLELGYPVLIWVRPIRPLMMAAIVLMHVGIGLTLGLTEFSLAMIAGNLAFCRRPLAPEPRRGPGARSRPGGSCMMGRARGAGPRWRFITAGDPDRLVEPVDLTAVDVTKVHPSLTKEACLRAMHLVRADGRVESGYDAVMTVLGWTPPFWPLSLVRHVPGISAIGRRVYQAIADAARATPSATTRSAASIRHTPRGSPATDREGRRDEPRAESTNVPSLPRLFLFEPGWRIAVKSGSEREFCYRWRRGRTTITACSTARSICTGPTRRSASPAPPAGACSRTTPRSSASRSADVNVAIDELFDVGFDVLPARAAGRSTEPSGSPLRAALFDRDLILLSWDRVGSAVPAAGFILTNLVEI